MRLHEGGRLLPAVRPRSGVTYPLLVRAQGAGRRSRVHAQRQGRIPEIQAVMVMREMVTSHRYQSFQRVSTDPGYDTRFSV